MRLGTTLVDGGAVPVLQRRGALLPLAGASLLELIAAGTAPDLAPDAEPLVGGRLAAPLRPPKIVAIGLNYLDHVRDPIEFDRSLTERVDWEVELAAVVGRPMRNVATEDALAHVFGYTVANDVSARDLQFGDGQWVRGKSLDTFCPLGPVIVTADELPDPQVLGLRTRVNGETVQDSNTAEMVFGVAELLAFCSDSFTLEPGDVVLTGTPWGCGEFMDPRRSLRHGDVVEVEVDGIGVLRNEVVVHRAG
jgi:2-keto-4-pentenoate hydratase/2-oxohepta-3-ene-1,7-dioic acid hydratase in catechol pathway